MSEDVDTFASPQKADTALPSAAQENGPTEDDGFDDFDEFDDTPQAGPSGSALPADDAFVDFVD